MKNLSLFLVVTFVSACASKGVATVKEDGSASCSTVKDCSALVSSLTGQHYAYPSELESRKIAMGSPEKLTSANAEAWYSNLLMLNDMTRVPSGQTGKYNIIEAKNALMSSIPTYAGSKTNPPVLPGHSDFVMVNYTMVDNETALVLQRFITDLATRAGRVNVWPSESTMVVTEAVPRAKRILEVLQLLDKPMSPEIRAEIERHRKEWAKKSKNRG